MSIVHVHINAGRILTRQRAVHDNRKRVLLAESMLYIRGCTEEPVERHLTEPARYQQAEHGSSATHEGDLT